MPPRSKSLIVLAFVLFAIYLLFWRNDNRLDYGQPPSADIVDGYLKDLEAAEQAEAARISTEAKTKGYIDLSEGFIEPDPPISTSRPERPKVTEVVKSSTRPADVTIATAKPVPPSGAQTHSRIDLKKEFENDYATLGEQENVGAIYGTTLNDLVDFGAHDGFKTSAALDASNATVPYSPTTPLKYDAYPDYSSTSWKSANKGTYRPCDGPDGPIEDMLVFPGRPQAFGEPPIGSYIALEIDSNMCFERETRLGPYGFQEEGGTRKQADWDSVNWGNLQQECAWRNWDRYGQLQGNPRAGNFSFGHNSNSSIAKNSSVANSRGGKSRRLETIQLKENSKVMPDTKRTAIIVRTHSNQIWTENDKQNIRALISELSLGSGGEYQVYISVQVKDETLPIWTDATVYNQVIQNSVPKEFGNMTVLWNDAKMKETYPLIMPEVNNVHQSQWLSVQKFAQDHPHFDYYWNWEIDTRYTGHYYNLLEKLAAFAKAQPRKYLWERNERYYIPAYHGPYEEFRKTVEPVTDRNSIWGPPPNNYIRPVGPIRPNIDPKEDNYKWGAGEEADYISLAPLFNPVLTKWVGRHDIWGFLGSEETPRRAAIGTQSRCSKLLLDTMHEENLKGNHASSEMTPQTVALLHGLKAVYAPIPMFFDRAWDGEALAKYFNPGPRGESGNNAQSPFSWGNEERFSGSTWYYRATPPMRLYNNWLGWEDSGIGGPEWEKLHGRICLPPMLLHPVKDPAKPPPGYSSRSTLPY